MNVIVACEESGVVRHEFEKRGHKVLSCDLLPTRIEGPHYTGDVFDVADYPWDLAILHPPCTHTSVSGAKHFAAKWTDGRQAFGVAFALRLWRAFVHVPHVAMEQPVSILSSLWRKPDQIIQPWQFGHGETKATCLWLKGLPALRPTNVVDGREARVHFMAPSPERARLRSTTYTGIAQAMAEQWGIAACPPASSTGPSGAVVVGSRVTGKSVHARHVAVVYTTEADAQEMAAAPKLAGSLKHMIAIVRMLEGELRASEKAKYEAARALVNELEGN